MRRLLLLLLLSAPALPAQQLLQSPLTGLVSARDIASAAVPTLATVDSLRPQVGPEVTTGFVAKQLLVSAAGFIGGGMLGGAIGAASGRNDPTGWTQLGNTVGGVMVGGVIGSATFTYLYGERKQYRGNLLATFVGGAVGLAFGGAFPITVPVGSVVGYLVSNR